MIKRIRKEGDEVIRHRFGARHRITASRRKSRKRRSMPAMDSMKRYIKRYGIPKSVYLDKHTTYKSSAEPTIEEQLNDQKPMSHFEKSLDELAIEVIHANSP